MKKTLSILLALFMVIACMAGCGNSEKPAAQNSEAPKQTGAAASDTAGNSGDAAPASKLTDIKVGLAGEPTTLDPHGASLNSLNAAVQSCLFATLVEYDSDTQSWIPYVATSWEWTDDITLTVKIRDDVYSQNGTHLTAEDVVYSLKRGGSNPALANTYTYFDVPAIEAVDDTTVLIRVKEPNTGAYGTLGLAPCALVCKADVEAVGEEAFARNPVGTGPYKLDHWDAGNEIVIVGNKDFWGDAPAFNSITFKFIPDTNARSLALQSGDIDFVENLGASMIPSLKGKDNVVIHQSDIAQTQIVWFNPENEYLSNLQVRRALEYATNKEAIIASVFNGVGKVADSIFTTPSKQYIPPEEDRSYNPEKAKQLLKEAGYENGFTLELACYESTDYQNLLQMIQQQWAEVGVTCNIVTLDKGAFFDKIYGGNFDVYTIHMVGADPMGRVASCQSSIPREGGNIILYANPRVDELLRLVNAEKDENKKNEYYKEMAQQFRADCPYIPIAETYLISASVPGITNVKCGQTSYILYYKLQYNN